MIDLVYSFPIIFPDRVDPENPGEYLCRFCGKPTINSRRKYYCRDKCHNNCYEALSWEKARRLAFIRDNGTCQMCGTKVYLHGNGEPDALKWIKPEYHKEYRVYYEGERKAEIHHIIPCEYLTHLAYKVTREIEDEILRRHWDYKLTAMLELDVNNLTTLCRKPCHDIVHSSTANKARKAGLTHRLLTDFSSELVHLTEESKDEQ